MYTEYLHIYIFIYRYWCTCVSDIDVHIYLYQYKYRYKLKYLSAWVPHMISLSTRDNRLVLTRYPTRSSRACSCPESKKTYISKYVNVYTLFEHQPSHKIISLSHLFWEENFLWKNMCICIHYVTQTNYPPKSARACSCPADYITCTLVCWYSVYHRQGTPRDHLALPVALMNMLHV